MTLRRLVPAALLALAAALPAAPAHAADTRISTTSLSQLVSAHGGRLAWSEPHPEGGARLMTWANGVASQVPVERQEGGFDVDLGRGPDGRTVAVYSRCEGSECSLYLYDFATAEERRLTKLSRRGVREQGPVVDRELLVFSRRTARGHGLYVGSLRNGTVRRIPKLPSAIGGYDFQGRRLAYTEGDFEGDRFREDLWVHDVHTGKRRSVARTSSGLMSSARMAGPTFAGRHLYAAKVRRGAEGNRFLRIDLKTGRVREALGRKALLEVAFTQGRAFYLAAPSEAVEDCAAETPCALALTPKLGF